MPEEAESIIAKGQADMISMARPFLADPAWPVKAKQGRVDEINTCIACNQACLDHVFEGKPAGCLVNPRACAETDLNFNKVSKSKKIAVIGAGPAGITFAIHALSLIHLRRCPRIQRCRSRGDGHITKKKKMEYYDTKTTILM